MSARSWTGVDMKLFCDSRRLGKNSPRRRQQAASETYPSSFVESRPAENPLRLDVRQAARLLCMSRAQLYNRIKEGLIRPQKDGARTYISRSELVRYVESLER
jgi:hypothetical protein